MRSRTVPYCVDSTRCMPRYCAASCSKPASRTEARACVTAGTRLIRTHTRMPAAPHRVHMHACVHACIHAPYQPVCARPAASIRAVCSERPLTTPHQRRRLADLARQRALAAHKAGVARALARLGPAAAVPILITAACAHYRKICQRPAHDLEALSARPRGRARHAFEPLTSTGRFKMRHSWIHALIRMPALPSLWGSV